MNRYVISPVLSTNIKLELSSQFVVCREIILTLLYAEMNTTQWNRLLSFIL